MDITDTMTTDLIEGQVKYELPEESLTIRSMRINGLKVKIQYPILDRMLILKDIPKETIQDGLKINCYRILN